MTKVDLHPIRNNSDLPDFFKQHILKRIEEQNGQYGLAWRLIRRYREGRYCLAEKAGGRLCLNNAKIPGDGPRGRCGWHGGSGRSGPKTKAGKAKISAAQKLRWASYRIAQGNAREGDAELVASYPTHSCPIKALRQFSTVVRSFG
jgi:hypothetical protein